MALCRPSSGASPIWSWWRACWWTAATRANRSRQRHGATEGHGSSRQAQRTAYVCRDAQTLDRRTVFRVAGKVPTAMEELRTKTEYQLADDPLNLPQITAQEIVNRL